MAFRAILRAFELIKLIIRPASQGIRLTKEKFNTSDGYWLAGCVAATPPPVAESEMWCRPAGSVVYVVPIPSHLYMWRWKSQLDGRTTTTHSMQKTPNAISMSREDREQFKMPATQLQDLKHIMIECCCWRSWTMWTYIYVHFQQVIPVLKWLQHWLIWASRLMYAHNDCPRYTGMSDRHAK